MSELPDSNGEDTKQEHFSETDQLMAEILEQQEPSLSVDVAVRLIESGSADWVIERIDRIQDASIDANANRLAYALISSGRGQWVVDNLARLPGISQQGVVRRLINNRQPSIVLANLDKLPDVSAVYLADKLISVGYTDFLVQHLSELPGLDLGWVAQELVYNGDAWMVFNNIDKFRGIDLVGLLTKMLASYSNSDLVFTQISKLPEFDYRALAGKLLDQGMGRVLVQHIEEFPASCHQEIADRMISGLVGDMLADTFDKFQGLDSVDICDRLIEAGRGSSVARNLEKFPSVDHNKLAQKLVELYEGVNVAKNLEKFHGIDHADLANKLVNEGFGHDVASNLQKFEGVDHNELANKLIDVGDGVAVIRSLQNFTGLSAKVADKLLSSHGNILKVLQNPGSFDECDWGELLLANINAIDINTNEDVAASVVENFTNYGLSGEDAFKVLKQCCAHYSTAQKVKQLQLESIMGAQLTGQLLAFIETIKPSLKGVRTDNPYKENQGDVEHVTSSLPDGEWHARASEISKLLRRAADGEVNEYTHTARCINEGYEGLRAELASKYTEDYAEQLLGYRGNVAGDSWPAYRRLWADYLAQQSEPSGLTDAEFAETTRLCNESFLQVLKVDVPYYDKLFKEWDVKRLGQREFEEVFLGRDGVYAYIGRRAQIQARQRRLGLSAKESPLPTYLTYPRGFIDALTNEVKQHYLSQQVQNPKAAHYYDTGFTGTIPQDIMRVLGIPEDEWDQYIRLLSSSKRERTVLGLEGSKRERDHVVNVVESNAKDERSAEGLYLDDQEQLRHYAKPTQPIERLRFRMAQLALHRHYYTQELSASGSGDKLQRFEDHDIPHDRTARLSDGLAPEEANDIMALFSADQIGASLIANTEPMKIADPADPYPEEAVFQATTSTGRQLIIKNVVPSKQAGPIDEFEALLLLERLGVAAPRPVARIFTEYQAGFIVMEKLPGVSGRAIKQQFEELQLDDAAQQKVLVQAKAIMTEIAARVRSEVGLDKPWRLKDFMIELGVDADSQTIITSMLPIDFERAQVFDPDKPKSVQLGQDLD